MFRKYAFQSQFTGNRDIYNKSPSSDEIEYAIQNMKIHTYGANKFHILF